MLNQMLSNLISEALLPTIVMIYYIIALIYRYHRNYYSLLVQKT